jgi:hypothetical protein
MLVNKSMVFRAGRSNWITPLVFTGVLAVCFLLTSAGLQFYEDGMDSIAQTFQSDLLVDGPAVTSMATGKWLIIDQALIWLHGISPAMDWYGLAMFLLMGIIAVFVTRLLRPMTSSANEETGPVFWMLSIGIVLLFMENLVLMQYSRVAFFLCMFPMLLMFFQFRNGIHPAPFQVIIGTACFAIGALIRMETAALSVFIIAPVLIYSSLSGPRVFFIGSRLLLLPVLITAGVAVLMLWPSELGDSIRLHNRFLHNADGLRYDPSQLGITDSSDARAYEATLLYFMNDPQFINEDLINRIELMPMSSASAVAKHIAGVERFVERFIHYVPRYVGRHWGLLLFALACFAFSLMFPATGVKRSGLLMLLATYTLLFGLIAGYIKIEDRVFNPMVFTIAIAALLLSERRVRTGVVFSTGVLLVIILAVSAEMRGLGETIQAKRANESATQKMLNGLYPDRNGVLVMDTKLMAQLHNAPFRRITLPEAKEYFSIDNGILFLYPGYHARAIRLFGTVDTGAILSKLAADKSNVFVSTRFRAIRIVEYFNLQHGLSLEIDLMNAVDGIVDLHSGDRHGLVVYRLR